MSQQNPADSGPLLRECLLMRKKTEADAGAPGLDQKNYSGAEPMLLASYEGMKEREANPGAPGPQGKPRVTEALERLVQLYDAWDKPEQAAAWRNKLEAERRLPKDEQGNNNGRP